MSDFSEEDNTEEDFPNYTIENSPTEYLCDKLNKANGFEATEEPWSVIGHLVTGAISYLCGKEPEPFTDPSKYYKRNHVKLDEEVTFVGADGKKESFMAAARLFPMKGGFWIGLNPFEHETKKDLLRAKWHELAHTLFYKWDGEIGIPEYQGRGWRHTKNGQRLEEEICEGIAYTVCPKPRILLGGKPAVHYYLVNRLKQEDCEVYYISDEARFNSLLFQFDLMPWRDEERIVYDLVIFDTSLMKPGEKAVVHESKTDYFLNEYFYDIFEDTSCAKSDPVIVLADDELADAVQEVFAEREREMLSDKSVSPRTLIQFPYDINEITALVKHFLPDKF